MARTTTGTERPPRPSTRPRIVAHRGASGTAPENTLAALARAAALGAAWVEVDVSLLGDGTAVLAHDATLDRCTDATGPLGAIGAGDLADIDAGGWFDAAFAGERIPTLGEALDTLERLGLSANLELKPQGAAPGPLAASLAGALAGRPALAGRVLASSFDHAALDALRAAAPALPIAPLWHRPAADWRETVARLGAEAVHAAGADLDAAFLAEARAAGLPVRAFTLNDPVAALPLREAGLDAVVTDYPERFLADPGWAAWAA
ncbi:MAG: glycerophosphodiester phosphodiesterase family protein [Pseudomonadota bacterium]